MDKNRCNELLKWINEVLSGLGEEMKLKIGTKGPARFTETSFEVKLSVAEVADSGIVMDQEAQAFGFYVDRHGLPADWLGKQFEYGEKTFKIIGYRNRGRRRIKCQNLWNKGILYVTSETVRLRINRQESQTAY